ncbi:Monooxygenase, FAD-binding [Syntrophomonas zehnderi OL-4]|uniref:Monooxygenase, FAD-binding n=2 Tax=Syntrophomonas TaxID=862 RepID=A0A0E3W3J5_9FIRM|nr:Monooxygenase, FAD-binding [Syntrophomonas zehnderi OL-4]
MSEADKMDVIIIGAGPAGIACAYILAQAGKEVLVIERAETPGAKNVTGGRLYTYALEMVDKGLTEEAVLERKITHEQIMILSQDKAISIDYHDPSFNREGQVPQSYSILRAQFDEWFAAKAEEIGAMVACGVKVDDLIEKDGKIIGVVAGEDEMYADVVIAADGVNSFMAQKAGLIKDISAHQVGVGIKEVIELPPDTIQERFNLKPDEGAARMILGCTEGIHGGGFLYTNRESISLGCVLMPEEAAAHGKSVHEIFQDLKMHPAIYPLIAGGESIEYGAHLVSEEGYRGIPQKIYREGFLMIGDAAGFVINTGYSIRGIDLAIVSGVAAARAVLNTSASDQVGPAYLQELKNIELLPTMQAVDGYADLLAIPRIYSSYPRIAVGVFERLFTVNGQKPNSLIKNTKEVIKSNGVSMWQLFKDVLRGYKSI